jgi:hypothetical protein
MSLAVIGRLKLPPVKFHHPLYLPPADSLETRRSQGEGIFSPAVEIRSTLRFSKGDGR